MKKKFQWGRRAPGFPATRLRKAVLMSALMVSGLVIMTCWGYAGESSVESRAVAADDTCSCKKIPPQPGDIGCDSIKVITFQGGPGCVDATTIYEDCELNSSGTSDYLALGFWNGRERRILLRFNLDYIVDSTCINPPLALVAQFDSVRFTLYTTDSCVDVDTCRDKTRQFFVGRLQQEWNVGANGKYLSACQTLDCGDQASTGSVNWCDPWKQCGGDYIFSTDANVPRNVPLSQTSPGDACIDSVMFVCHRPSPYNRYIKQTIKEWISDPDSNFGWVIMPDSSQRASHPNSALLFHSPSAKNSALRPKLTMYFTAGVDRDDDPVCGTVSYIKLPGCPAATGRE
jgi:hypothetical protein